MFQNYFKTAWRSFFKDKVTSFINLIGLSVGITAILLIALYIYNEISYDNFQQKADLIYRVGFTSWQNGKVINQGPEFTAPFGADAQNEFAEISSFVRVSSERSSYITYKDKTIKVDDVRYADSSFFRVFSYKLEKGNAYKVLQNPYTIVLTKTVAENLFGNEDAIGKLVRLDNQADYTVTGVSDNVPSNTHLNYNALISFVSLYKEPDNYMGWNGGQQYSCYLLLKEHVNAKSLEQKLPAFMWKHINEEYAKAGFKTEASLQPLKDIHLHYSDVAASLQTNIYVFSIVALLVLVISCVNYINLSTAKAITRFREVGVRKVLGAGRGQLIKQFTGEAILLTTTAYCIAIVTIILLSPVYEKLMGQRLPAFDAGTIPFLLLLFAVVLIVGIIAGGYVAFYLSSFNAISIFKTQLPKTSQSIFRKGLIVGQFAIATGLMACTVVVSLQLKYSRNLNRGFDKDHVLVLPLIGQPVQQRFSLLQEKLLQLSSVENVSGLSEIPYDGITTNGFTPEGDTKAMMIHQLDADENLLKTMNIKLASGEFFAGDKPTLDDGYVINETLAETLGWKDPLGKTIKRDGVHKIVGVVKDFHFASLHDKIEPLIITNKPWDGLYAYIAIKYSGNTTAALLNNVKTQWKSVMPAAPFDYWFLDDAFDIVYKSEEKFRQVFVSLAALSIVLSLAGIFALVLLTIKQRTKEFGVRKVLGAKATDIIKITVKDFAMLIILGSVIITPIAWFYISQWLQHFAYRIQLSWWIFALCGLSILLVSVITISFQAIKAALANPVKSLRTE